MRTSHRALKYLATFGLLSGCQEAPDYSKPGSWGVSLEDSTLSSMERQDPIPNRPGLPDVGDCTTTYGLLGHAFEEPVACKGYDYGVLYQSAHTMLEARAMDMKCPDACPARQGRIVYENGSCSGAEEGTAAVFVQAKINCAGEDVKPPEYEPLTGAALRAPFERTLDNGEITLNEELDLKLYPHDPPLGLCPRIYVFGLSRIDGVKDCREVTNYQPYVDAVRRRLHAYHQRLVCPSVCPKAAIDAGDELYFWKCAVGQLYVEGYLKAECTEPM